MLKFIGITVGALSIFLFMWQSGIAGLSAANDTNQGAELVSDTELASEQVLDLTESFNEISLKRTSDGIPSSTTGVNLVGEVATESTLEFEPEDSPVTRMIAELARLSGTTNIEQSAFVAAVNDLKAEWSPRYRKAIDDYEKLTHRVRRVENTAQKYFELQLELTEQINNPNLRATAAQNDAEEYDQFEIWRVASNAMLNQLNETFKDLHDMNIVIDKLNLSANFSVLYDGFESLTLSISQLHEDLDRFREKSDHIARTFGR